MSEFATRAKAAWARLIRKACESDPLECPRCRSAKSGPMRVVALIDDPGVVRRILEHLGRWAPDRPQNAVIPLTYHPVPDIA